MRLIDADSVKKGIDELKQSPWYYDRNRVYFVIRKNAVEIVERLCIDKEPTIDAIPISFLEKLSDNAQNEEAALMIDEIIAQWRKENADDSD